MAGSKLHMPYITKHKPTTPVKEKSNLRIRKAPCSTPKRAFSIKIGFCQPGRSTQKRDKIRPSLTFKRAERKPPDTDS